MQRIVSAIAGTFTLSLLLAGSTFAAEECGPRWRTDFREGLFALDRGQWTEAVARFQDAGECRPTSGGLVALGGYRFHYLPHLYLGAAHLKLARYEQAHRALQEAERQGVAAQTRSQRLLARLQNDLATRGVEHVVSAAEAHERLARTTLAAIRAEIGGTDRSLGRLEETLERLGSELSQARVSQDFGEILRVRNRLRELAEESFELERRRHRHPPRERDAEGSVHRPPTRGIHLARYSPMDPMPDTTPDCQTAGAAEHPRCWLEWGLETARAGRCDSGAILLLLAYLQAQEEGGVEGCPRVFETLAEEYDECSRDARGTSAEFHLREEAEMYRTIATDSSACRDIGPRAGRILEEQRRTQGRCAFLFGRREPGNIPVTDRLSAVRDALELPQMGFRVDLRMDEPKTPRELLRNLHKSVQKCMPETRTKQVVVGFAAPSQEVGLDSVAGGVSDVSLRLEDGEVHLREIREELEALPVSDLLVLVAMRGEESLELPREAGCSNLGLLEPLVPILRPALPSTALVVAQERRDGGEQATAGWVEILRGRATDPSFSGLSWIPAWRLARTDTPGVDMAYRRWPQFAEIFLWRRNGPTLPLFTRPLADATLQVWMEDIRTWHVYRAPEAWQSLDLLNDTDSCDLFEPDYLSRRQGLQEEHEKATASFAGPS